MEQIRNRLNIQSSGVFEDPFTIDDEQTKVTTEIFDSSLPSQLKFDEESIPQHSQSTEQEQETEPENKTVSIQLKPNVFTSFGKKQPIIKEDQKKQESQYQILTRSIINFTLRKQSNILVLRQTQHTVGSFIPFELKVKTFPVKFYDEMGELSDGASAFRKFWKSVVGYVKVQMYIKNGFIYLLERRKEGFCVRTIWNIENLFKVFSDRDEGKLRLVFREKQGQQMKIVTKQLQNDDLNLLAHLFEEAKSLQITSE